MLNNAGFLEYKNALLTRFSHVSKDEEYHYPQLLKTGAIIKILGISKPTLYELMKEEGFPYYKISASHSSFEPIEVLYWLKERTEREKNK